MAHGDEDSILYYLQQDQLEEDVQREELLPQQQQQYSLHEAYYTPEPPVEHHLPDSLEDELAAPLAYSTDSGRLEGVPEEEEEDWRQEPSPMHNDRHYYYYSEGDVPAETRLEGQHGEEGEDVSSNSSNFSQEGYGRELDMDSATPVDDYYEDCHHHPYYRRTYSR